MKQILTWDIVIPMIVDFLQSLYAKNDGQLVGNDARIAGVNRGLQYCNAVSDDCGKEAMQLVGC